MNLLESFRASSQLSPEKVAIYWGDDEWTYGKIWDAAAWLGKQLVSSYSIRPRQNIGLWMKNCPHFAISLFGIYAAQGVAVPINNFLKGDEVAEIIADADVDVILCDETIKDLEPILRQVRPNLVLIDINTFPAEFDRAANTPEVPLREADLAVLIYTSGTTGRPKGIMLSHGNLLHNVESCRQVLRAMDYDRFVVVLPMFHSFMLCVGVFLPLLVTGSIVVLRTLGQPKAIIAEIIRRQATILPAIPQFFRSLCHPSVPRDLPLRLCISGGAPLPAEILKDFTAAFPIPLLEGYGLSETSPVACFNPIQGPWKAGSIGLAVANVEVSLQDDDGKILGPGETGEVCVRGGNVMMGYWKQPEETTRAMRDGWLLTGDIGHRDEDNYFYITDRKKDMLLVNGINVYPRQVEEIIYQFPGVREAAVVGIPDPRRGEQPIAFVSASEGQTLEPGRIIEFVKQHLADYKVPKHVRVLPSLPRNATGKILKTALRALPPQ